MNEAFASVEIDMNEEQVKALIKEAITQERSRIARMIRCTQAINFERPTASDWLYLFDWESTAKKLADFIERCT